MKKQTLSGPAIFMYSAILLTALISAICFALYYSNTYKSSLILWCGIVSFMILYHFGLRILMGEVTKRFKINFRHPFYKERKFEKKLYKLLKVRKWKDKVLTFEPENYDFKHRTLEQLATTMSKSELDHWINEGISVFSIFFTFIWGCAPAFLITAVAAMLFDAQFIIVQRYNRPIVIRLMNRKNAKVRKEHTNNGEKMKSLAKTYIFDMDGTLIDSLHALDKSIKAMLDPLGIDYPENIVEIVTPLGYEGAAEYLISLGINSSVETVTTMMKEGMIKEYSESIPAKPFASEVLKKLYDEGNRLCILSASPQFLIKPCVKRLDIEKYFDFIWSSDDFNLKKSDKNIYIEAAKLLGTDISECVFADDNLTNITAAKAAGMQTLAVYDLTSAHNIEKLKATANRYIYSFEEF